MNDEATSQKAGAINCIKCNGTPALRPFIPDIGPWGASIICTRCGNNTGYFSDPNDAVKTWERMNGVGNGL